MVRIESDHWRLWCNPDNGAEWLAAEVNRNCQWHAVVPDCRDPIPDEGRIAGKAAGQDASAPLTASSFHMLPYSNRIRDGRFAFAGRDIQLKDADRHAIHGALRKLPWQLVSHDGTSIHCRIDSRDHPGINWPWHISAEVTHRLEGNGLISSLTLTNRDETAMPAGLGWHPYFVREIAGAGPRLTLPVQGVFPDANGDCLPDGPATALPAELDFRSARELAPSQFIDCCMAGLNGDCRIEWPAADIALTLSASDNCRYLVLYNPAMPHFAVEPVTNANDAFNLAARGVESGMQVLAPAQALQAEMRLVLDVS